MRLRFLALAMSGVAVASSACSVDATSPLPLAVPERAGSSRGLAGPPKSNGSDDDSSSSTSSTFTFRIDPSRDNLLRMGAHTLWLPASAICDPSLTSYGTAFWNDGCTPLASPVTIIAKVRGASAGLPRVDLEPELRFNPRTSVYLTFAVKGKQAKKTASMRILYCATSAVKACVDEALGDPSLKSVLDRPERTVFRRIKHFSGYLVAE